MSVDSTTSVPVAGTPSSVPGRAPNWLRAIFMANLVAQTGIVLTGGLVRLTGSGLGCRNARPVPTCQLLNRNRRGTSTWNSAIEH